jgi:hypothetical protein
MLIHTIFFNIQAEPAGAEKQASHYFWSFWVVNFIHRLQHHSSSANHLFYEREEKENQQAAGSGSLLDLSRRKNNKRFLPSTVGLTTSDHKHLCLRSRASSPSATLIVTSFIQKNPRVERFNKLVAQDEKSLAFWIILQ